MVVFVILAAQYLRTPAAAFAPSFPADSIFSSHSALKNAMDSALSSHNVQLGGG